MRSLSIQRTDSICRVVACILSLATSAIVARGQLAPALPVHSQLSGLLPNSRFGSSVAMLGDLDGDGCSEILVVELGTLAPVVPFSNRATVISGSSGMPIHVYIGDPTGYFTSGDRVGDCNGDGIEDFALATATNYPTPAQVRVYSGQDGSLLQTMIPWTLGTTIESVCGIGDLDGDGRDDVAAGVFGWGLTALASVGAVFIFSGATGNLILQVSGLAPGHLLGFRVAGLGDINGDGFPDIAVRASGLPGQPLNFTNIHVFALTTTSSTQLYQYAAPASYSLFGDSIACAGDIDRDGHGDFMFGTPLNFASGCPTPSSSTPEPRDSRFG